MRPGDRLLLSVRRIAICVLLVAPAAVNGSNDVPEGVATPKIVAVGASALIPAGMSTP